LSSIGPAIRAVTGLRAPGGANVLAMLMLVVNIAGIGVSFLTGDLLAECAARLAGAYTLPVSTMVWLGTAGTLGSVGLAMMVSGVAARPMERMLRECADAG
jgi:hypothetical protein